MDLFLIIIIILGILAGLLGLAFFILQSRVRDMRDYIYHLRKERPFRSSPPEFIPVGKSSRELKEELLEKNEPKLLALRCFMWVDVVRMLSNNQKSEEKGVQIWL
jgi:hypothetical protein